MAPQRGVIRWMLVFDLVRGWLSKEQNKKIAIKHNYTVLLKPTVFDYFGIAKLDATSRNGDCGVGQGKEARERRRQQQEHAPQGLEVAHWCHEAASPE